MYRITYTARAQVNPEREPVLIESELSEDRPDTQTLDEAKRALQAEYRHLYVRGARVDIQIEELRNGEGTAGVTTC